MTVNLSEIIFFNTTIILPRVKGELALPLNGKRSNLQRSDLLMYFAEERLGLSAKSIAEMLSSFIRARHSWEELIDHSFLSLSMKEKYHRILRERFARIFI